MISRYYVLYLILIFFLVPALAATSTRKKLIENNKKTLIASIATSILNSLCGPYTFITYSFFVISSSMMTRVGSPLKLKLGHRDIHGRGWRQVLGVGLVPGITNLASLLLYLAGLRAIASKTALLTILLYAVSTADTWSSEVGMLYRRRPRLVLGLKEVETGTSGAVTPLGSAASILGSFATAAVGVLSLCLLGDIGVQVHVDEPLMLLILLASLGFAGELLDSVLGCLIQEKRRCVICGIICEQETHCGVKTEHVRGCRRFSGEAINMLTQLIMLAIGYAALGLVA